jgi:hypothetical protein
MISCGGGGSGDSSSGFSGSNLTLDLGPAAQNIPLTAGTTWSIAFSVQMDPGDFNGPLTYLDLDLSESLSGLTFTPGGSPAGLSVPADPLGGLVLMTMYVAPVDAADPCATGIEYGPFTITLDPSFHPLSVSPETESADQSTLAIINTGAFSACIEVQSPLEATASQDEAAVSFCDEPIADIAGTWVGTYYCTSSNPDCSLDESSVELYITQAASGYANYTDDGDAFYSGNVCGYSFSFDGGGPGYDESGIFIMEPDGLTATKTSYYEDWLEPYCTGACYETLTRLVDE